MVQRKKSPSNILRLVELKVSSRQGSKLIVQAPQENITSPAKTTSITTTFLAPSSSPRNANPSPPSPSHSSKKAGHPEHSKTRASSGHILSPINHNARMSGLRNRFGGMRSMISRDGGGRKGILGRYTLSHLL